ncbi:glutamate receptor ionotropic, delta-2-like, partial [Palaemon carinicauda]|uniref:glutamate receptor ionotropic, delta-2-like n=1 Tax=Palaemon carinicauda TaxID=392227 RepID=UPI0035B5A227
SPTERFLEAVRLYLHPNTYIVLAGSHGNSTDIIQHDVFRNTANIIYLGIKEETISNSESIRPQRNNSRGIEVFSRCLYCNGGNSKTYSVGIWNPKISPHIDTQLFEDQFKNFHGHTFRIVCLAWFPYTDYTRTSDAGGTIVYPQDSLDVRMLNGIAKALNFSYEMRVPWDNQWGTSTPNGNWTGIVGTLQYHKGDFSMMLSWLENRLPVVDYSRVYSSEPLVMVTAKSKPLSQSFALVRPFTGQLWALFLLSVVAAGFILWILQKLRSRISDEENFSLDRSILVTWAIILEDPPLQLPENITAQMLIGWWWLYCMLVTITYRSSLIAHLTVPGKSPELNSLEDLLIANRKQKWTWGFEPTYGSGWEWLKLNENPTVEEVFKDIEVLKLDEQIARVLAGQHAFITWKYYIRSIILSKYTDERGYTPMHTSKSEFFNYGGYGWGFRKGAPFRGRIDIMKLRLIESGAITFWMNDLIESSAAKFRIQRQKEKPESEASADERSGGDKEGTNTVLGLGHLQGVFYLLIMGNVLGLLSFVIEYWFNCFSNPDK